MGGLKTLLHFPGASGAMGGTVGGSIEHSLPLPQSLPASMAACLCSGHKLFEVPPCPAHLCGLWNAKGSSNASSKRRLLSREWRGWAVLVDFSHCSGWCKEPGGLEGAPRCGSCPLKSQHTFLVAFMDRKEKVFHFIEHIVVEPLWLVDQFSCNKV